MEQQTNETVKNDLILWHTVLGGDLLGHHADFQ